MIEGFLRENADADKAVFDAKIIHTKYPIFGVKTSVLDAEAKRLAREGVSVYDIPLESHEAIVLAGCAVAYEDVSEDERVAHLKYIMQYFDNWASVDTIVPRLKKLRKKKEFFVELLTAQNPFYRRTGIIFLLKFYLKSDMAETLRLITGAISDDYYVKMAVAWALAEAMIYDFEYAFEVARGVDDEFVRMKACQKAIESYRISSEQKAILREYKSKRKSL